MKVSVLGLFGRLRQKFTGERDNEPVRRLDGQSDAKHGGESSLTHALDPAARGIRKNHRCRGKRRVKTYLGAREAQAKDAAERHDDALSRKGRSVRRHRESHASFDKKDSRRSANIQPSIK